MRVSLLKRAMAMNLALLFCAAPALATFDAGDVVIKKAKAYSDKAMTQYACTIPAYTALLVEFYDPSDWTVYYEQDVAHVQYGGSTYYIATSALWNDDYKVKSYVTLPKKTKVYQRPSKNSASIKIKKKVSAIYCLKVGKWVLVRTNDYDHTGRYGYVYVG